MIDIEKEKLLDTLRQIIYKLTGNYYPDERLKMLEYKVSGIIKEMITAGNKAEDIIDHIIKNEEIQKKLINLITVPETRFFRETEQLETIKKYIFPKLTEPIFIASAGCSTGEEAYTIAMMLKDSKLRGKVVGMDINEIALSKAKEGKYSDKTISQIPMPYREFVEKGEDYIKIKDEIKKMVEFTKANLINRADFERFKEHFHIVMCRNVLIYFDKKSKKTALENIRISLREEGYLVLSSTEMLTSEFKEGFEAIRFDKFMFYRKKS